MTYIKVTHRGRTYGPLQTPITLRTVCRLLNVPLDASPTLIQVKPPKKGTRGPGSGKGGTSKAEKADSKAITDKTGNVISLPDKVITCEGLFELLTVSSKLSIPDPEEDDIQSRSLAVDAPVTFPESEDVSDREITETEQPRHLDRDQILKSPFECSNAQTIQDLEIAIEAMMHLIASVPPRLVRYNAILSKSLDKAVQDVSKMQKHLADGNRWKRTSAMETTKTPPEPPPLPQKYIQEQGASEPQRGQPRASVPPTRTHSAVQTRKQKEDTLGKLQQDHPDVYRIMVLERIINILTSVWSSVWTRFGPRSRYFHPTDMSAFDALTRAEQSLNRWHLWRRVCDDSVFANAAFQLNQERTRNTPWSSNVPAYLFRRAPPDYKPPYLYLTREEMPRSLTPWMDPGVDPSAAPGRHQKSRMISGHSGPHCSESTSGSDTRQFMKDVRLKFLDAMLRTGVHRDHDLEAILDDLLDTEQKWSAKDEEDSVGQQRQSPRTPAMEKFYEMAKKNDPEENKTLSSSFESAEQRRFVKRSLMREFHLRSGTI
ncbi:hypothetical protein HK102_001095 [Quaeritorhiza haematococci]|nr:hypothetical protein HK102_001095 [Quaeritorhiza haematococci]